LIESDDAATSNFSTLSPAMRSVAYVPGAILMKYPTDTAEPVVTVKLHCEQLLLSWMPVTRLTTDTPVRVNDSRFMLTALGVISKLEVDKTLLAPLSTRLIEIDTFTILVAKEKSKHEAPPVVHVMNTSVNTTAKFDRGPAGETEKQYPLWAPPVPATTTVRGEFDGVITMAFDVAQGLRTYVPADATTVPAGEHTPPTESGTVDSVKATAIHATKHGLTQHD
jgi:hypothetical protein